MFLADLIALWTGFAGQIYTLQPECLEAPVTRQLVRVSWWPQHLRPVACFRVSGFWVNGARV